MKKNEDRYGYPSCPCRPAYGFFEQDRDIICPCDYRDPDIAEYGACYCALYVDKNKAERLKPLEPIPERRSPEKMFPDLYSINQKASKSTTVCTLLEMQLWYCKQCGYVVYREQPPYICPICRAKKELFTLVGYKVSNEKKKINI